MTVTLTGFNYTTFITNGIEIYCTVYKIINNEINGIINSVKSIKNTPPTLKQLIKVRTTKNDIQIVKIWKHLRECLGLSKYRETRSR